MKHNNEIPNNHFRKEWDLRVRTWFDQPARKLRRRNKRSAKSVRSAPRPVDGLLRPVVRCQTVKYNSRPRLGRGFSSAELKEAGISTKLAETVGISFDARRKNRSIESMQANVQRLKEYQAKLILFPRVAGKPKSGDSAAATSLASTLPKGELIPLERSSVGTKVESLTADMGAKEAYRSLRIERTNAKHAGLREKRAREAAAEDEEKKK